jgi:hypothetical protein
MYDALGQEVRLWDAVFHDGGLFVVTEISSNSLILAPAGWISPELTVVVDGNKLTGELLHLWRSHNPNKAWYVVCVNEKGEFFVRNRHYHIIIWKSEGGKRPEHFAEMEEGIYGSVVPEWCDGSFTTFWLY